MDTGIDVVCLVSVMETRRIHPATFRFVRAEDGKLKQSGNDVEAQWVGFHEQGFTEPASALRWLSESGANARYQGPGFNVPLRQSMTGTHAFALATLMPYNPQVAVGA